MSGVRNPSWLCFCRGEAPSLPRSSAAVPSTDVHAASAARAGALVEERLIMQTQSSTRPRVHDRWGTLLTSASEISYSSEVLVCFNHCSLSKMMNFSSDYHEFYHLFQNSQNKYSQSLFTTGKLFICFFLIHFN